MAAVLTTTLCPPPLSADDHGRCPCHHRLDAGPLSKKYLRSITRRRLNWICDAGIKRTTSFFDWKMASMYTGGKFTPQNSIKYKNIVAILPDSIPVLHACEYIPSHFENQWKKHRYRELVVHMNQNEKW